MSHYILSSSKLKEITNLLQKNNYKKVRDRCNDHTHYNFYYNLLLNDNELYFPKRITALNTFSEDLEDIFIQHFAYIFYLNDHYMMSSEYVDSLDLGLMPEEESKYYVAPFIQDIFDKIIKNKRPDIANEIKKNTSMQLQ
jgi:hypothetical protein